MKRPPHSVMAWFWFVMFCLTLLAAEVLWLRPAGHHAAGCQSTVCYTFPCSTSMSGDNGLHTPDDAIAPPQDYPLGCNPAMTPKAP